VSGVRSTLPISEIKRAIQSLPKALQREAARRIAYKFTELFRRAYAQGRQVDGSPRPLGVRGNKLTLRDTGMTQDRSRFASNEGGRVFYVDGNVSQWLVKYGILPNARAGLPEGWRRHMAVIVDEVMRGLVRA
jgi:hypothetical protein